MENFSLQFSIRMRALLLWLNSCTYSGNLSNVSCVRIRAPAVDLTMVPL